jgi:hypothetical protein
MCDHDDTEPDVTTEDIVAIADQIRRRVLLLRLTTHAILNNRRTPLERQAVIDRARRACRRSAMLRYKYGHLTTIH